MSGTFVVFDVETPNASNSRMSAIGLTVVEDGRIVDELFTLVNPETYFHPFNIALTGITPEMAERAPTFDRLWETIGPVMSSGLLVAHNAPFDMSVLAKCLRAYCIDWRDQTGYACTVQMSRRCWPQLPNHKLDTLCAYLDIPLDHHKAGPAPRSSSPAWTRGRIWTGSGVHTICALSAPCPRAAGPPPIFPSPRRTGLATGGES